MNVPFAFEQSEQNPLDTPDMVTCHCFTVVEHGLQKIEANELAPELLLLERDELDELFKDELTADDDDDEDDELLDELDEELRRGQVGFADGVELPGIPCSV